MFVVCHARQRGQIEARPVIATGMQERERTRYTESKRPGWSNGSCRVSRFRDSHHESAKNENAKAKARWKMRIGQRKGRGAARGHLLDLSIWGCSSDSASRPAAAAPASSVDSLGVLRTSRKRL